MTKRSILRQEKYQAGKITFKEYVHDLYEEYYGSSGIERTKSTITVPPTKVNGTKQVTCFLRPTLAKKALGYYSYSWNRIGEEVLREHISINLQRVLQQHAWMQFNKVDITFDDLFSHILSHEHIHRAIMLIGENPKTCASLDTKNGKVVSNPVYKYGNGLTEMQETDKIPPKV